MAHALAAITARIDAILFEGRGADGALGARAQALSIPANQFKKVAAPVRDGREPSHATHRALWRGWESFDTQPSPINSNDAQVLSVWILAVEAVYVAANGLGGFVRVAGSEDNDASASDPTIAALSDAQRIRAALSFPGLFRAAGDVPAFVEIAATGEATLLNESNVVIARQTFRVRLWGDAVYQP